MDNLIKKLLMRLTAKEKSNLEIESTSLWEQVINPEPPEADLSDKDKPQRIKWRIEKPYSLRAFIIACWRLIIDVVRWLWLSFYQIVEYIAKVFNAKDKSDYRHSVRFNLVLYLISVISAITVVVLMLIFFIKGVLFYPKQNEINDYGTITMTQPAAVEHNMFLLNAARTWAPTGISIAKGDRVTVTVSGSFYGSIADIEESAKRNLRYRYSINNFRAVDDSAIVEWNNNYCIENYCVFGRETIDWAKNKRRAVRLPKQDTSFVKYHNADRECPRFGSLLLQIHGEGVEPVYANHYTRTEAPAIIQMPPQKRGEKPFSFKAKTSGSLYVMVNDVYFPPEDSVFRHRFLDLDSAAFRSHFRRLFEEPRVFDISFVDNRLSSESRNKVDLLLANTPRLWYDDNVGEVLLNITVQRGKAPRLFKLDGLFLRLYRFSVWLIEYWWVWLISAIAFFLYFWFEKMVRNGVFRRKKGKRCKKIKE